MTNQQLQNYLENPNQLRDELKPLVDNNSVHSIMLALADICQQKHIHLETFPLSGGNKWLKASQRLAKSAHGIQV